MSSAEESVNVNTLSLESLIQFKAQLEKDTETLMNSLAQLQVARRKFEDCKKTVAKQVDKSLEGHEILVPLTGSLYVPGKQLRADKVLVDVGTGYYVEKNSQQAIKFYQNRIDTLNSNAKQLQSMITDGQNSLKVVQYNIQEKSMQRQKEKAKPTSV